MKAPVPRWLRHRWLVPPAPADNRGSRIGLAFSDAAMDAITRMYCDLIVAEMVSAAEDARGGAEMDARLKQLEAHLANAALARSAKGEAL